MGAARKRHLAFGDAAVFAALTGMPVTALCGATFTIKPKNVISPDQRDPRCAECAEASLLAGELRAAADAAALTEKVDA